MNYKIYNHQFEYLITIDFSNDNFKNLDKKVLAAINKIKFNNYFDFSKDTPQKVFIKFIFKFMIESQKDIDEESRRIILDELQKKNSNLYIYQNFVERRFFDEQLY